MSNDYAIAQKEAETPVYIEIETDIGEKPIID